MKPRKGQSWYWNDLSSSIIRMQVAIPRNRKSRVPKLVETAWRVRARAVILGGVLMAAGHLMMTVSNDFAFFAALGLLIVGNGFFKPNISTIVGSLYPPGSPKRDGGFTIFYIGINLGAAAAPLLCGYVGENIDWHYGFGLATIGMLTGIAVFVAPSVISQVAMFAAARTVVMRAGSSGAFTSSVASAPIPPAASAAWPSAPPTLRAGPMSSR